ncbi:MAG TPA: hypothetical protein VE623_01695 [Acidimicrobiales bacterium]|jgi:hypothetical protein|nr:hypothetical protein [Acidimicrobiales bacterium]
MTWSPCLIRPVSPSGEVRYELGHPLVDRYLEFVAARARPNTTRATAFDLKSFFAVVAKDPLEVTVSDVFDFIGAQRGDRSVVRLARWRVRPIGSHDRPTVVVGVWLLRVRDRPGRHRAERESCPAGVVDAS